MRGIVFFFKQKINLFTKKFKNQKKIPSNMCLTRNHSSDPLPPKMPHASTQILSNARDRYIQCMINVSSCSEVQSALRLAEISLIFPSITVGKLNGIKNSKSFQNFMTPKILNFQNLVHLTSDNIKVLDAMRVLEADQLFRDVFIVKP